MSTVTTERPPAPPRTARTTTTAAPAAPAPASAGAARLAGARARLAPRFAATAFSQPAAAPRRRVFAVSLALHAVLVVLALALSLLAGRGEPVERRVDVVFYPPTPEAAAPLPEPIPEPEPVEIARAEPEPPAPEPVAPPVVREPRPEPVRPAPRPAPVIAERRPEPRPLPVPVEPRPRPVVKTNVFATNETPEPARPAPERVAPRAAGFTVPATEPLPRARAAVAVKAAGFGTASTVPAAAPDPVPARVVTGAAFADEPPDTPVADRRPRPTAVASTGFETAAAAAAPAPAPRGTVQAGGFGTLVDDAPAGGGARRAAPKTAPDTPVEVLSKARPVYTETARERRIEGEVVLQVRFGSDGSLHVLQVLERLGHGLDEAAVEAVKQIEFKPARREGKPVDHTATLRVVFKLA